ncbi:hypothetical protein Hanom_Chr15g01361311 [Helianthus anomalus]
MLAVLYQLAYLTMHDSLMLSMIHFGRAYGNLEDCSSFHKTPLLRRCLDRIFFNITRKASLPLYLSGSHDPIIVEYKDLCRSKPIFGLLPPPLHNHNLNVKLIWLRVTFNVSENRFALIPTVTGLVFDPHVASPSPQGQANHFCFFVWVTGFVLPWTHQESGANSRLVVRSSFARLDTYTSSLTLTPSPIKSRTIQ